MKKEYLECGKIVGPHGVRGLVKVESWCDSPRVLCAQKRVFFAEKDGGYREAGVISAQQMNGLVLMHIAGIEDREYAQSLRGCVLYLNRNDIPLPEGGYFIADVIGLDAIDYDSGKILGKIEDISDSVASRLYTVRTPDGRAVLIPDVEEFIKKTDVELGVYIKPIPGFFED